MRAKLLNSPHLLFATGVLLMLLGIAFSFLIVIWVLESTFFINFFSGGASVWDWHLGRSALRCGQGAGQNSPGLSLLSFTADSLHLI